MAVFNSMEAWYVALGAQLDKYPAEVGAVVWEEVRQLTPVDTGYAKSRWKFTPTEVLGAPNIITNDAPYIIYLENGHSSQAPNGMVKVAMAKLAAGNFFTGGRLKK